MFKSLAIGAAILIQSAVLTSTAAPSKTDLAWEHFKAMAGEWVGAATDGRKIRHRVRVIAAGSVVMEESWFEAHEGEMMVTLYHRDGEQLMLTHYCVAKNQPRMTASEISEDGKRVLFSFRDGTNIPTRDKGHMDKALFEFTGKDRFRSRWTWYAAGKEQWMEQFEFARAATSTVKNGIVASAATCCPGS